MNFFKILLPLIILLFSCNSTILSQEKIPELNLSSRGLKDLSNVSLSSKLNILKIDLSHNQLSSFPIEIFDLKGLKHLILSGNSIEVIPSRIIELDKLEYIALDNNLITTLPNMKSLSNLKYVYIYGYESLTNEHVKKMECNLPKGVVLKAFLEFTNYGKDCDSKSN